MTISVAELAALRLRKQQLLAQKAQLVSGFGMLAYDPYPKQDQFHRAGAYKRRMFMGGNRCGKSHLGSGEDCAWLYGCRPWYPEGDPARTVGIPQKANKGLVITIDWGKVHEVWTNVEGQGPTRGKLWQMLPSDFVKKTTRNHMGCVDTVVCQNGSVLNFDVVRAYKNDPMGSESSDYDFIHVDEPIPENMWKAASRGLVDRGGSAWLTLTPLREPWITDMFIPREKFNPKALPWELVHGDYWFIRATMYDNIHLSAEGRRIYEGELNEDEKQCRILGIPLELSGLVYKEFDQDRHILTRPPENWTSLSNPPATWPVWVAIDVHPQTPHAVLFLTVSPKEQLIVFDEIFHHCTISELSEQIKAKTLGRTVIAYKCDPSAWINDPITGSNMQAEFERCGIVVEKATKALGQGILRVQDELKKQNRLYFSQDLLETLWEIRRYCWDEKENRPVDRDDHMMENLYRLCLEEPYWVECSPAGAAKRVPEFDPPAHEVPDPNEFAVSFND